MKLTIATACALLGAASAAVAATSDYNGGPYPKPGHSSFEEAYRKQRPYRPPTPAPQPTYRPAPSRSQFAPVAPIAPIGGPAPRRFKPYGDYSKGGSPSAPNPPGYMDLYGSKRSEHPFLY